MNQKQVFIDPLDMAIADVNSEWVGITRKQLMENAGKTVADFIVEKVVPQVGESSSQEIRVLVFSGAGGNGGDGFVAARHLATHPRIMKPIQVFLVGNVAKIRTKITRDNYETLQKMIFSIRSRVLTDSSQVSSINLVERGPVIIIDALLGTGVRGKIREPTRTAITQMNTWKEERREQVIIVSIDVPSGMDPSTGKVADVAVNSDWIIALHAPKSGMVSIPREKLIVRKIGIPPEAEMICGPGHVQILKQRFPWDHKGDYGELWIVGGSNHYTGAPVLSALAAQQLGIDLVTIFAPRSIVSVLRSFSPNIIVRPYDGDHLTMESLEKNDFFAEMKKNKPDAILIGPGCGDFSETLDSLHQLISMLLKFELPLIIDADALKVINRFTSLRSSVTLTPHAGEFRLITGMRLPSGDADILERIKLVNEASSKFRAIFVVKGRWDVISGPTTANERVFILGENDQNVNWRLNITGTAAMTVGGTGDVLAGTIAALNAMTRQPFHSACLGTYLVGRAGELAEERQSLIKATDVVKYLLDALVEAKNFVKNT